MSRSRKQKSAKKKPTANSQTNELALSPLQEQIEALKQDQQWFLKQIKRKRTEFENLVEQMQEISRQMFQQCAPVVQKMMERDREIHQLFAEVFEKRKMGKKSTKKVRKIYESLQRDGIISPEPSEADAETNAFADSFSEDFSEESSDGETHQKDQETPTPTDDPPANQRKIRETFLRLASHFHPDKVTDSETQTEYTAIMQEMNKAYQEGNFAKLLEIERRHDEKEAIAVADDDESSSEKRRLKLTRENELLKEQYEEIKEELRYLRRTPEGQAVTDYRRATKEGFDPITDVVEEAESQLETITTIRDFVRDFRDKKITIQDFLEGPDLGITITEEDLEAMLEEMFEVEFFRG